MLQDKFSKFFILPAVLCLVSGYASAALIDKIELKGSERILDIGCGDGIKTANLSKRVRDGFVLGVDKSDPMVRFAKRLHSRKIYPNLDFHRGEAEKMRFSAEFDGVVAFSLLHWTHNHQAVIERVNRALKPEGFFVLSMPLGLPQKIQAAVESVTKDKAWRGYFKTFEPELNFATPDEYRAILTKGGFEIKDLIVEEREDVFPNRRAFIAFLGQWFPYIRPLPLELKALFLTEVTDHYLQLEPTDAKGRVKFSYSFIDVVAIRKKN